MRLSDEEIIRRSTGEVLRNLDFNYVRSQPHYQKMMDNFHDGDIVKFINFYDRMDCKCQIRAYRDGTMAVYNVPAVQISGSAWIEVGPNVCQYVDNYDKDSPPLVTPLGVDVFEDVSMPTFDELDLADMVYPGMTDVLFDIRRDILPTIQLLRSKIITDRCGRSV